MDSEVKLPLFKLGSAWAAVGITSWADVASVLAALYTFLLVGEFLWKHFLRDWWHKWQSK